MRTRFKGPFRQEWLSLCSQHMHHEPTCELCQAGEWHNRQIRRLDHWIHKCAYPIWFWWHNRPNSRTNRFLRQYFPKLKR